MYEHDPVCKTWKIMFVKKITWVRFFQFSTADEKKIKVTKLYKKNQISWVQEHKYSIGTT